MTINTYNNSSPNNKVTKSLTVGDVLTGYLREGTSLENPVVIIESDSVPSFNYAEIPDFNRKYFVTTIRSVTTKLWEIHMHCDVLSTYWEYIKQSECLVNRSESKRTADLVDTELWCTADSLYGVKKFSQQPLTGGTATKRFVMVVPGAGVAPSP